MVSLGFIDVDEVVLHHLEIFGVSGFQVLYLFSVLLVKFGLDVIIGIQDSVHILISLFLGFQEAEFGPVELVLESSDALFVGGIHPLEKALVLSQDVDFSS